MADDGDALSNTLRDVVVDTLKPLTVVLAFLLSWTAYVDRGDYTGPYRLWPSFADVGVAAFLGLTGAAAYIRRPPRHWAHPWGLAVVTALSFTSAVALIIAGVWASVPVIALVALGSGLVMLSVPWLVASLAIVASAWAIATLGFDVVGANQGFFVVQVALVLGGVTGWVRIRTYHAITKARLDAEVARARAARLNDELEHFASVVTHDLQTPLSALRLKASIARVALDHDQDDSARKALLDIDRIANQSGVFVHEMLDYARSGEHTLKRERIQLDAVVKDVADLVEAPMMAVGGKLIVSRLPAAYGDPVQMRQLFLNLISNSIRYRREGVALEVRVFGHEDAGGVAVTVEDNGQGFDPAESDRLFVAFEMGEGGKGHGLGLATCKRIVTGHGGTISAEGRPGEGATFYVEFPRESVLTHESGAAAGRPPQAP